MYEKTRNPSIAKFRTRLEVIRKASHSGLIMAENWNPKGRYFHIQREMIDWFEANEKMCEGFLAFLAPKPRRKKAFPEKTRAKVRNPWPESHAKW